MRFFASPFSHSFGLSQCRFGSRGGKAVTKAEREMGVVYCCGCCCVLVINLSRRFDRNDNN